MKVYSEDTFEKLIVEHLVLHGGYEPRGQAIYDPAEALAIQAGYDIDRALIPAEVIAFVRATQPKPWAKLRAIHGTDLDSRFIDVLCKVMDQRGALSVIPFVPLQGPRPGPLRRRHRRGLDDHPAAGTLDPIPALQSGT